MNLRQTTIFILLFLFVGRAHAIGEIERIFSWGVNLYSYGAVLAEVENHRKRIEAQTELKKAEMRLALEADQKRLLKGQLQLEISATSERVQMMNNMLQYSRSRQEQMKALQSRFDKIRSQQMAGATGLQVLMETTRQELELDEISVEEFAGIAKQCQISNPRPQQIRSICLIVEMITAGSAGDVVESLFKNKELGNISDRFRNNRLEGIRIDSRLSRELEVSTQYLQATKKRLAEIE